MRIAFFGTPEFAVPTLRALAKSDHTLSVFTQPDRPVGRKAILTPPPVKAAALELGLPVYQFERIRSAEGCAAIRALAPDLYAVVAFGQLFSEENLSIPPLGAINVHGSLLPLYRGASPMQQTVIDGQPVAGVSTMKLVKRMDAGDVLLKAETPLGKNETYGELAVRLAELGAELFMRTLDALERGELSPVPQDEEKATYCRMLTRDSGKIDLSAPRQAIHDLIRGTNPWPGAYALLGEEKLKLWRTVLSDAEPPEGLPVGGLFGDAKKGLFLRCRDGALEITEMQAPGGKKLDGKAFLRGKNIAGSVLS
ncbi:MAG: methionyl-tRNA formyltransferase [Clostridia bacterium]|nr:methionyl-tRNA formyltransferase [Clostridia bacterium]